MARKPKKAERYAMARRTAVAPVGPSGYRGVRLGQERSTQKVAKAKRWHMTTLRSKHLGYYRGARAAAAAYDQAAVALFGQDVIQQLLDEGYKLLNADLHPRRKFPEVANGRT